MTTRGLSQNIVATLTFLLCIQQFVAFRIGDNVEAHSGFNINEILNSTTSWQNKWLLNATIPSYLNEFLKVSQGNGRVYAGFLDELLDGVSSDSCKGHVTEWFWRMKLGNLENLMTDKEKWVLQMIDAWGKLPEGILSGHISSYGDFHECVQIEVTDLEILNGMFPKENIAKSFEGQYCTSYILDYNTAMQVTPKPLATPGQPSSLEKGIQESVSVEEFLKALLTQPPSMVMLIPSAGICMPNSCSLPDVQQILVNGLNMVYSKIPNAKPTSLPWPVTINCADNHKPAIDGPVITVIVLLVILVTLCLVAGILDYWYSQVDETCGPPGGKAYTYLMAFSLYTNMKKWMSTRKSADDLGCLHGIRFLSTAWVVLAHTYFTFLQGPQWNMIDLKNSHKNWTVLAVINGTFSVDTFFLMSGMLATYNILKMLEKNRGKFNVIMFYVHRYIRLTPTYAILVAIAATLMTYAGNGPSWYAMDSQAESCRKNWWRNILYINNFFPMEEMCNGESWYLANDMQFYILSPLIVYPIWKWQMSGIILLIVYTMLSCIAPVLVVKYQDAPAAMAMTGNLEDAINADAIYVKPWTRISPFLAGVWLGWLLHKTRGKRLNLSRPFVAVLWLCSTGIAMAILFAIHPWFDPNNTIPPVPGYFYAGLSRFAWGVAVSWVIFACVKGYGGVVNRFLSWNVFMPLGRLCFCVYLTSIHLQSIFHSRLAVPFKWDTYNVVNLFFAHMVMSYFVGFICTLVFESPFITLQKLIFEGKGGKQVKSEKLGTSVIIDSKLNNNNPEFHEKSVKSLNA